MSFLWGLTERGRVFSGRHPLFVVGLLWVICFLLANIEPWLGWLSVLWLRWAAYFIWRRRAKAIIVSLLGAIALASMAWREHLRDVREQDLLDFSNGKISAIMLENARGDVQRWTAAARLDLGKHAGAIVWWKGHGPLPVAGSQMTAFGMIEELPKPRNPGEFDTATWLSNQGVCAVFLAREEGRMITSAWARWLADVRLGFRNAVTAGIDPTRDAAAVIRAIVIGEHPQDAEVMVAAFRNSGTLHAFSVSGLHVAMAATIGWFVLGAAGVPRRVAIVFLIGLVFGYAWITGNSAPAVRSAWMAALFFSAFWYRRRPDLLNSLGAVLCVMLLWDGRMLFQAGVQLSYGVVAAIALGTAWASRVFAWMAESNDYLPPAHASRWAIGFLKLRRSVSQSLTVSLAAGIGSTPLTAFHFGLVTPISILAGVVIVPIVFVILSLGLAAAVFYNVIPPLARGINQVNAWVADRCVDGAEFFANVPGGHFQWPREHSPFLLVYQLKYGDAAALFSHGWHGAVWIDCGGPKSFQYQLAPSIKWLGIQPQTVILTHADGGHMGGAQQVWAASPIKRVLLPVERSRSPSFRAWRDEAPNARIECLFAAEIKMLELPDGAVIEVLHAPDPHDHHLAADKRVVIFRMHWQGWRILFTSDSGSAAESELLASGRNLSADFIIAGKSSEELSLNDIFLEAINPQAI
ncbi:MAG: DUF4131 domain-containing protein, partial [Verrucomicrobia bacterium]